MDLISNLVSNGQKEAANQQLLTQARIIRVDGEHILISDPSVGLNPGSTTIKHGTAAHQVPSSKVPAALELLQLPESQVQATMRPQMAPVNRSIHRRHCRFKDVYESSDE